MLTMTRTLKAGALAFVCDAQLALSNGWATTQPGGPHWTGMTAKDLRWLLVVLPTVLTAVYLTLFAANRYESEAIVSVKQVGQDTMAAAGLSSLIGGNPSAREDVLYLQKFMHSLDVAQRLDRQVGLREHYESTLVDVLGRLWEFGSQEDYLAHFRARVQVQYEDLSSTLTIRVQGYTPEMAQRIAAALLAESEAFVNDYSRKIARDRLVFAERELEEAGKRVQQVKESLLLFQRENQLLDPMAQAKAESTIYAELRAQISRLEAELKTKQSFLSAESFEVRGLRNQIAAIERQLRAEGEKTTAQGKDPQLNEQAARFQDLVLRVEFAQEAYKLALGALEASRVDSIRKAKSLVVIEPPGLPDSPTYPERLYWIATIFLVGALLYGILRVVIATLLEHQDPNAPL